MTSPGFLFSPRLRRHFEAAKARRAALGRVSDDEWQRRQLAALQSVWADACRDVPHYGGLVDQGRAPNAIQSWQDVQSIPELTRDMLQDHPERFERRSRRPDNYMRTAGSTGTPLQIGMTQVERDLMRVVKIAAWQDLGYTTGSRVFLIWGHSHLLGTGVRGQVNHLKRAVADRLLGYRRVDAYRLGPAICAEYAEALIAFRPMALISYASALDLFARYTTQYRDRFRALGLRFVLATAEPAPRPDTVSRLEDLFGCPVVEEYGGAEFGQVAFKRGREPFEVYHDLNYLECLPPGPGDAGAEPALVTTLYPRYLPLIRYRVGDALTGIERLPNGHVRRFEGVAGRINDVIRLDDGDSIHSVAIFHCIHQEEQVHSIQVVLTDDGIEASLITTGGDRAAMEERIRARLAQVHPSLARVRFRYVEDLQSTRAGKRRWYIDRRTKSSCVESPAS
jgi:phenylacetate-CoA ligase